MIDNHRSDTPFTYDEIEASAHHCATRRKRERALKKFFILFLILVILAIFIYIYVKILVPRYGSLPRPWFMNERSSMEDNNASDNSVNNVSSDQTLIETNEITVGDSAKIEETGDKTESESALSVHQIAALTEAASTTSISVINSEEGQAALAEAEILAEGYDYDGAINVLSSVPLCDTYPDLVQAISEYQKQKDECVAVDVTMVPHIFYHSLLNSTARAFDTNTLSQAMVDGFNAWMVTTDEFDQITQRLYDAGYVYVRLRDLVIQTTDADGNVHFAPNTNLMLPEGKKAIVLSVDDCSYYHSYEAAGFPTKLVLDENGDVKCLYTDDDGNTSVGDYDVVPRLNTFLDKHPDGSYHGARGIMAMTGYNGVFGYRTDTDYLKQEHLMEDQAAWLSSHPDYSYEQDVADATKIADALKEEGWEFASHTWGHLSVTDKTVDALKIDNEKWVATVEPIVGPVDTIIFAHGNDIGSWEGYTEDNEQYAYYKSAGYNFYCNVDGSVPYWVQITDSYVRQGRIDVDGYRLWIAKNGEDTSLSQLIDLTGIFNEDRPTPVEAHGQ